MKTTFRRLIGLGMIALAISFGTKALAVGTPREEVAHAYRLLKVADKDYGGHRVKAMEHLQAVGKELGLNLQGDLPNEEAQWVSDQRLKEARQLLRNARDKMERKDRRRAAEHLNRAVQELDVALKIN